MSDKPVELINPLSGSRQQRIVIAAIAVGLLILLMFLYRNGADIRTSTPPIAVAPAIVEPIGDTGFSRVILTDRAAQRLDIQTTAVAEQSGDGASGLVVPYSAVIYGLYGETWVYVNSDLLTYHREPVIVDIIESGQAYLTAGPAAGTPIVTVGVAELFGTETGVGK